MRRRWMVLLLAVALTGSGAAALAQGVGFDLSWWTVDGGGVTGASGGGYELHGTAGQPDAGVLEGGGYTLTGGFWSPSAPAPDQRRVFLPMLNR